MHWSSSAASSNMSCQNTSIRLGTTAFSAPKTATNSNGSNKLYLPKVQRLNPTKQKTTAQLIRPPSINPSKLTCVPSALQATSWSSPYFNQDGGRLLDNPATSQPPSPSGTAMQSHLLRLTRALCPHSRKDHRTAVTNKLIPYCLQSSQPKSRNPLHVFSLYNSKTHQQLTHKHPKTTLNLQITRSAVQFNSSFCFGFAQQKLLTRNVHFQQSSADRQ